MPFDTVSDALCRHIKARNILNLHFYSPLEELSKTVMTLFVDKGHLTILFHWMSIIVFNQTTNTTKVE